MDLIPRARRLVATLASSCMQLWSRATWPARLAILFPFLVFVAWILQAGWVGAVAFLIGLAIVLVWLASVLSKWRHLSWPVRLVTIDGIVFVTYLAMAVLGLFIHKQ